MSAPVSVIIPCYKQEQWLERAIQSAREAGSEGVLIFQDDYYRSDYRGDFNSHIWRHNSYHSVFRAGVCYARNLLIEYVRTEFILPLDADDQLYPDAIERLYAAWQPGTWVYGNHTEIDEQGNVLREVEAPPPGMLYRKNLTYATFLFHKDDWQRAGGYDPTFEIGAEDYAFQVALTACGVRPVKLDGAPIYKRMIHPVSRTSAAVEYFPMLQTLMRRKWPSIFAGK